MPQASARRLQGSRQRGDTIVCCTTRRDLCYFPCGCLVFCSRAPSPAPGLAVLLVRFTLSASFHPPPFLSSAFQRYSFYLRFRLRFLDSVRFASSEGKKTQVRCACRFANRFGFDEGSRRLSARSFFFSFCLHVSGSRRIPHRSGEQTNNAVAVRLAEKLFVKKSSSRAAVHPSAPLLSRAWKPAELITSAPFSGSGGEGKAGHKKGGEGT